METKDMRATRKLILALALVAGPMAVHAQLIADEAVTEAAVDSAPPVDLYGLSHKTPGGNTIHIFPSHTSNEGRNLVAANIGAVTPPLTYHGGPVMQSVTIYTIFWIPPTLQDGSATGVSSKYVNVLNTMLSDYPAHGIDNNNTQYYQGTTPPRIYIKNIGKFGKTFTDTSAYPASTCNDPIGGTNCITDAQMQAEISKVIASQGWPNGGLTNIYFLFTSSGEVSCFDSSNTACAYNNYCAYHTNTAGSPVIIYANEPYGDPTYCQNPGQPSPSGDVFADTETTSTSHELTEAITDPEPNTGWINSAGSEIGDLCAYNYGTNGWDAGKANQNWNGHFYEIQMEWDNHKATCEQLGP
jgi:hypothetical protein